MIEDILTDRLNMIEIKILFYYSSNLKVNIYQSKPSVKAKKCKIPSEPYPHHTIKIVYHNKPCFILTNEKKFSIQSTNLKKNEVEGVIRGLFLYYHDG